MKIHGKDYHTVWFERGTVKLIDQPKLPHKFRIYSCKNYRETANAIKTMVVRGAGAIGVTAGYGMLQAILSYRGTSIEGLKKHSEKAASVIESTRPTAVDLFHAVERMLESLDKGQNVEECKEFARMEAQDIAMEDLEAGRMIGEYGNQLIEDKCRILTHCNAGALAFVDYGSALAPIRAANKSGKNIFVWVDETRPRCQGARLTSWELLNEGIDHAVIADNAAGHFMRKGEVDMCIVGADRVAANGDVANKIGTYEKAVVAKENKIPFYVAIPLSTIDKKLETGENIEIEERSEEEVKFMLGISGKKMTKVQIAPKKSKARNPAFDITPAKYITGFITPLGVVKADEISRLKP